MPTTSSTKPEDFATQAEADEALAAGYEAPDAVRAARKPTDFVPGEDPRQRAARLKILHGIVE